MARIRTIKPEFFNDDDVVALSDTAKIVFIGLWCHCDGNGVFQAKFQQLKRLIKPDQDMRRSMETVCREDLAKFIHFYMVGEQEFGLVLTFRKHQRIDVRNDPSKYPLPKGYALDSAQVWVQKSSMNHLDIDDQTSISRLALDVGKEGIGRKEGNRKGKGSGKEKQIENSKLVQNPAETLVGASGETHSEHGPGKNGQIAHNDFSKLRLLSAAEVSDFLRSMADDDLIALDRETITPQMKLTIRAVLYERQEANT